MQCKVYLRRPGIEQSDGANDARHVLLKVLKYRWCKKNLDMEPGKFPHNASLGATLRWLLAGRTEVWVSKRKLESENPSEGGY